MIPKGFESAAETTAASNCGSRWCRRGSVTRQFSSACDGIGSASSTFELLTFTSCWKAAV